ncbi:LPXTG cell wall anchor domain-containing protein [Streptomyces sp. NPDC058953]|uniref:LPXTG cell wall anchor domain-containing protein n=1 Tax=unclassified Streptomyces TaxID=2593676 RepID=UPI00369DA8AE
MKLRRAAALAAASAVLAPLALLSAPAAFATGVTDPATSAGTDTSGPAGTGPADQVEPGKEGGTEGGTGEEAPDPNECSEGVDIKDLKASLRGAPTQIVAGGGWKTFTYRVANESGKDLKSVTAILDADASGENGDDDVMRHVTIEAKHDGVWEKFDFAEGYLGDVDGLGAGEFAEVELRMKADAKAPAATGFLMTIAVIFNENGTCDFGEPLDYEFEILPAGGKPDDKESEGKPGKGKPNTSDGSGKGTAPQGERKELPVSGDLAATGSSDALPVIGIAGGIAIVAGAGVVFALKRRRNGATA